MPSEDERRLILEMIDSGKITAEQGISLLQALPKEDDETGTSLENDSLAATNPAVLELPESPTAPDVQTVTSNPGSGYQEAAGEEVLFGEVKPASPPPDFDHWRHYWMIPLWIGVGVAVFGALLMFWALQAGGIGFWFLCAGVPFTLGVLLMTLAFQSRTAHWLHLRVHQSGDSWPRVIPISFPLPLGLAGWIMRTFGIRVPGMETTSVDELLTVIKTSTSPENPLFIEVEDDEDGDRVQIYIG